MSNIHAVILDLDDTLYPERMYALGGFQAVARAFIDRFGEPDATLARLTHWLDSKHRFRVFDAFLAEKGLSGQPKLLKEMIEVYRTHEPMLELFPDAAAVLDRLRSSYRLGLITDGRPDGQWSKIEALKLRDRIDAIIVTGDLGDDFGKPHPRAFELMSERLQIAHHHCVYVADNPAKDFIAPNRLGWKTIRVLRPGGLYHDVSIASGGEPRSVITSLDDLEQELK